MTTFVDNITAEQTANINLLILPPVIQPTTLNGTMTMGANDPSSIVLTGTATGYSILLPNATALVAGHTHEIYNKSTQPVTIKDGTGAILGTVDQNSISYIFLQAGGTVEGIWILWNVFSGLNNYNITNSTPFATSSTTDVLVTGMTITPQPGTYAIWVGGEWSCSNASALVNFSVYNNAVLITDSLRSTQNLGASRPSIFSTQTISQVNGSQSLDFRTSTSAGTITITNRSMILIRIGA